VDDSQPTNLTDFPKNKKKHKNPLVQTYCQNIVGFFILKNLLSSCGSLVWLHHKIGKKRKKKNPHLDMGVK